MKRSKESYGADEQSLVHDEEFTFVW
jgi:hypothetical protein